MFTVERTGASGTGASGVGPVGERPSTGDPPEVPSSSGVSSSSHGPLPGVCGSGSSPRRTRELSTCARREPYPRPGSYPPCSHQRRSTLSESELGGVGVGLPRRDVGSGGTEGSSTCGTSSLLFSTGVTGAERSSPSLTGVVLLQLLGRRVICLWAPEDFHPDGVTRTDSDLHPSDVYGPLPQSTLIPSSSLGSWGGRGVQSGT